MDKAPEFFKINILVSVRRPLSIFFYYFSGIQWIFFPTTTINKKILSLYQGIKLSLRNWNSQTRNENHMKELNRAMASTESIGIMRSSPAQSTWSSRADMDESEHGIKWRCNRLMTSCKEIRFVCTLRIICLMIANTGQAMRELRY